MRVTVVGRTYLLHANRAKWRYLPEDVTLTLITPPATPHALGAYRAELSARWPHHVVPAWMTGRSSGFAYSPVPLAHAIQMSSPELVQVDEEPASLALLEVLLLKKPRNFRLIFFTWENLVADYRLPFRWSRQIAFAHCDGAIAGNREAAGLLEQAGFRKPTVIIPQLGIDAALFAPQPAEQLRSELELTTFTVGYVGRLIAEKGLMTLLHALHQIGGEWQWLIVGRGPLRATLEQEAQRRGIASRLRWVDTVPHHEVARYLNSMNVMVLPSETTPRWKEQFGHVLIEAMACGVPVVGSDSGAIPEVIGDAGLIFPQRDADALAERLKGLRDQAALRRVLAQRGRERVLTHYTDQCIAERTVAFWREVCPCA